MISWSKVTRPKELGGLGISDLQVLNWALRTLWLWLKKTEPTNPWASFQLQSCKVVRGIVNMAMLTEIGDGSSTLFWKDRWLLGQRIEELAPVIFSFVPKRTANRRTVLEALTNKRWIEDIHGVVSWQVLQEFCVCWEALEGVQACSYSQERQISTSGGSPLGSTLLNQVMMQSCKVR